MIVSYAELLVTNLLFIIVVAVLEGNKLIEHRATKIILYEKIALIKHGYEAELLADLKERTGLDYSFLKKRLNAEVNFQHLFV